MVVRIGTEVSIGVAITQIELNEAEDQGGTQPVMHAVRVTAGAVRVGKKSIPAGAFGYPAGETVYVTCAKGDLYVQGLAADAKASFTN